MIGKYKLLSEKKGKKIYYIEWHLILKWQGAAKFRIPINKVIAEVGSGVP